jgi:Lrp/AsnC family transcriptional regulator, leucine-responsive regulatory protein
METRVIELDRIDRQLLRALLDDARLSHVELSAKVGLSPTACARRLQRLGEGGIIRRYRAELDRKRLGFGGLVIVRITLERQSEDVLRAFEKAVARCPSVLSCYLMSGVADYQVMLVARDIEDYERVHNTQLSRLPHVARIESSFALREVVNRDIPPEILAG